MALFNVAVDSKLRACDIVALKVDDVAQSGYAADRASVRQKKTGRPVKFELTESTPQAIDDYLRASGKKPGERLFTGPQETRVQPNYSAVRAAIVRLAGRYMVRSSPVRDAFTASNKGAPHLPAHRQLAAAQLLLGHTKIESTVRYLGIEVDDALATSRRLNLVGRADMLCPSFTSGLGT
jgi:integrase